MATKIILDSCESTNSIAMQLAKDGCAHNTAVIAKQQTAGRGRLGRSWQSFEGNIALSLVVRSGFSTSTFHRIVSLSALAVSKTFEQFGVEVFVKWPNDILVRANDSKRVPKLGPFRKVGGILVELLITNNTVDAAVVGIGLNLKHPPTSDLVLEQMGFVDLPCDDFIDPLLESLEHYFSVDVQAYESVASELKARLAFLGSAVQVDQGDRIICGVLADYLLDGGLLIQTPSGEYERIYVGDLSLL